MLTQRRHFSRRARPIGSVATQIRNIVHISKMLHTHGTRFNTFSKTNVMIVIPSTLVPVLSQTPPFPPLPPCSTPTHALIECNLGYMIRNTSLSRIENTNSITLQ